MPNSAKKAALLRDLEFASSCSFGILAIGHRGSRENNLNNLKAVGAIILTLAAPLTASAQKDWVTVASTDKATWDVKAGSLEESKTKAGIPIALVIGRITTSTTNQIDLYKWYVSFDDCARKMGTFVTLGIDGSYKFEIEFVVGSGNVASAVAGSICSAYEYNVNERDKKGI